MSEVLAKHGNVEAVRYDKDGVPGAGAHHLHERDPVTGFKHLSSDEYLQSWGHDPNIRRSGEPLIGGGLEPPPGASEAPGPVAEQAVALAALQQQFEALTNQLQQLMEKNTQQIEQLTSSIDQLVQQLAQQNANFAQQNQNIMRVLDQLIANQQQGQMPAWWNQPPPWWANQNSISGVAAEAAAADKEKADNHTTTEAAEEAATAAATKAAEEEAAAKVAAETAAAKAAAELATAKAVVEEARKALARFALRRESRAGDYLTPSALIGRSQEDRRGYQEAMDAWKQAVAKYQDLRYDALMVENEGDEAKVASVLKAELIAENNAFIELKYKLNEERQKELTSTTGKNILGRLNAKKNQFAIWFSKQPTWRKWATGIAAGAGVGFAVSATAGVGLAAVVAAAGARYSLGLVSNKGSLINVSVKAKAAELKRVEKHYGSLLKLSTDHLLDQLHGQSAADFAGKRIGKETLRHMNKNRLGRAIMLGGAALTAVGLLGVDYIPGHFGWPGHTGGQNYPGNTLTPYGDGGNTDGNTLTPYSPGGSGGNIPSQTTGGGSLPGLSPSELKLDTIYSQDMHGFVTGTKDLLERQGISVQGFTDEKARLMGEYMQNNHWNLVEGMQNSGSGDLEQYVVDASTWSEGINNPSHAQAWTSKDELAKFMQVAHDRFGVEFSR